MDTTRREAQEANCSLCGELPDELLVRTGQDERFPAAFNKLTHVSGRFSSWGDSSVKYRCPDCGAKFVCEYETQFTGSGNNDEARIIRVQAKAPARELPAETPARHPVTSRSDDHAAYSAQREAEAEAAQARQAFSIMEKHFASAGAVMEHKGPPNDWPGFCSLFYRNTNEFLKRGQHTKLLMGLLAELVVFIKASSGAKSTDNLYELLKNYRHYGWLAPLLPDSARGIGGAMEARWEERRLEGEEEAERIRLGQMSY